MGRQSLAELRRETYGRFRRAVYNLPTLPAGEAQDAAVGLLLYDLGLLEVSAPSPDGKDDYLRERCKKFLTDPAHVSALANPLRYGERHRRVFLSHVQRAFYVGAVRETFRTATVEPPAKPTWGRP